MGMKILWSDSALADLEEIYDYYQSKAGSIIARSLVKNNHSEDADS